MKIAITLSAIIVAALSWVGTVAADDAKAQSGASISGRVTFTDGRPAWRKPVDFVNVQGFTPADVVRTDPDGRYKIDGLADGVYFVGKFDADRVPADKNPRLEELPNEARVTDPTIRKGQRVVIVNGQSVENVDFVITDIGPETVEGPEAGPDGVVFPETGAGESDGGFPVSLLTSITVLCALALAGAVLLTARSRRAS